MGKAQGKNRSGDVKRKKTYSFDRMKRGENAFLMAPNMQGFFVTCNRGREGKAVREICDLLDEYSERLWPLEENDNKDQDNAENDKKEQREPLSIEEQIAQEIADIKSTKKKPKRFISVPVSIDCLAFIQSKPPVIPPELAQNILEDLVETGQSRTRFCSRLIPVQNTCYANLDEIVSVASKIVRPILEEEVEPSTFSLVVKVRNCEKLTRDKIIPPVAALMNDKHKVDLENAEYAVVIEVFKNICAIGLVRNYYKLKRFNLQAIAQSKIAESEADSKKSEVTTTSSN
ncbi:hypothetical protein H4219_002016 [Mycoemilia scoparia]|uniref:THUMP domain-containing protein n=1 Tax=Mycoemilia scoparia TaxID=417184 RepID=A0A9W8A844_9FUNG|nr:hypothetical protein H4219_002016 [Mycoemilia scoparia]